MFYIPNVLGQTAIRKRIFKHEKIVQTPFAELPDAVWETYWRSSVEELI